MPVLMTDELAALLSKLPRTPVALQTGHNEDHVYGASAVYTDVADDDTALCIITALQFPKGKAPWDGC